MINAKTKGPILFVIFILLAVFTGVPGAMGAGSETFSRVLAHHTPHFIFKSADLGEELASKQVQVRLWLKLRNADQLDQMVEDLYDPQSPQYRHWLTQDEFLNKFAPTLDQLKTVRDYLIQKGLTQVTVDPGRLFVSARGAVADLEDAFKVRLHRFQLQGKIVMANTSDPALDDQSVSTLIQRIGGLSSAGPKPDMALPLDPETGEPFPFQEIGTDVSGASHETVCFRDPETHVFTTNGGLPKATYAGTRFGAEATNTTDHLPPCGYGPQEIQKAYGMGALYEDKLDGGGETVVIVDAFGSPTIEDDAATFVKRYGLPPLDLKIVPPAAGPFKGPWSPGQQSWALETSLDVEYAHVMAPGAKIVLVEGLSDSDDDLVASLAYVIDHKLGNVVSNSWTDFESQVDGATQALYNVILKAAAAQGISMHFSSGDDGDDAKKVGAIDIGFPTGSPYVTAIGGTSLALNPDHTIKFQTGWGTHYTRLTNGVSSAGESAASANAPLETPTSLGFVFGAGGGVSKMYAKPGFQKRIAGAGRMVPDISYLADPYTGAEVVVGSFDDEGNPQPGMHKLSVIGGTSLSCPMFSGLWAIVNQAAGASLGQAARSLYHLPRRAITDIFPPESSANVTGEITTATGTVNLTSSQLLKPQTPVPFISGFLDAWTPPYRWGVISFGTDSSLATARGWDPVTGLGTPHGLDFVKALAW